MRTDIKKRDEGLPPGLSRNAKHIQTRFLGGDFMQRQPFSPTPVVSVLEN